jgi:hypothetical protein
MPVLAVASAWFAVREPDFERVRVETLSDLEGELEALRLRLRIPGMSAAVAEGERYHLASLTKPILRGSGRSWCHSA